MFLHPFLNVHTILLTSPLHLLQHLTVLTTHPVSIWSFFKRSVMAATYYAFVRKRTTGFLIATAPIYMIQSGADAVTKKSSEPKGNVRRIELPKLVVFGVWSGVCDSLVKAPEIREALFEIGENLWSEVAA